MVGEASLPIYLTCWSGEVKGLAWMPTSMQPLLAGLQPCGKVASRRIRIAASGNSKISSSDLVTTMKCNCWVSCAVGLWHKCLNLSMSFHESVKVSEPCHESVLMFCPDDIHHNDSASILLLWQLILNQICKTAVGGSTHPCLFSSGRSAAHCLISASTVHASRPSGVSTHLVICCFCPFPYASYVSICTSDTVWIHTCLSQGVYSHSWIRRRHCFVRQKLRWSLRTCFL